MATGVDVVRIDRVAGLLGRSSRRFERRVFTPAEVADCTRSPWPARRFAQCFALKEAVLKAAGTGLAHGARWQDIEAELRSGGEEPVVRVSGRVAEWLRGRGVEGWVASVGGDRRFAVAAVVLQGP